MTGDTRPPRLLTDDDGDDGAVVPVLVIGAGPTGLTVALLLSSLGVATTVLDRRHDVHPLPRAVHLDDEAVRILQRAGVADGSRPSADRRQACGFSMRGCSRSRCSDATLRWVCTVIPRPTCSISPTWSGCCAPRSPAGRWVTLREGVEMLSLAQPTAGRARCG